MALEYGFNYGVHVKAEYDFNQKKYMALDDVQKRFYHESLPFILMSVGIGIITEQSIPHILARYKIACEGEPVTLNLNPYIGFKTNIKTESNATFLRNIGKRLPRMDVKKIDSRWQY